MAQGFEPSTEDIALAISETVTNMLIGRDFDPLDRKWSEMDRGRLAAPSRMLHTVTVTR
jgi:hypothetical protein